MVDDDRMKTRHPDSLLDELGLIHELSRYNCSRGKSKHLERDRISDAAGAARSTIADGCQHDIILARDLFDQLGCGILGEAMLYVVVHCREPDALPESRRRT